jgi:hypothetical protein
VPVGVAQQQKQANVNKPALGRIASPRRRACNLLSQSSHSVFLSLASVRCWLHCPGFCCRLLVVCQGVESFQEKAHSPRAIISATASATSPTARRRVQHMSRHSTLQ